MASAQPATRSERLEETSLLSAHQGTSNSVDDLAEVPEQIITSSDLWNLYVSHFLSTWNSRTYEFAAILLTTSAYPGTLLPSSIRGISSNLSTLILSPAIGRWINKHPSRLRTLQTTIVVQRLCIIVACLGWIFIFLQSPNTGESAHAFLGIEQGRHYTKSVVSLKNLTMTTIIILGVVERLSAVGNMLVMERNWVPTLATPTSKPELHILNASLRRIDLISKILAPIWISTVALQVRQGKWTATVVACFNALTTFLELFTANEVWRQCPRLRESRTNAPLAFPLALHDEVGHPRERMRTWKGLKLYFSTDMYIPSLSMALQSFSVLSLSGPMMTYLLSRKYTLSWITMARTFSSFIEIFSTISTPWAVSRLSGPHINPLRPLIRVGTWGLSWQLVTLLPALVSLFFLSDDPSDAPASTHPWLTAAFFVFLALSRLGLWTHNLMAQNLVQIAVPEKQLVEFSGVEMSFVSAAEVGRWSCTAAWSQPPQFRGVAVASMIVLFLCWASFILWARNTITSA